MKFGLNSGPKVKYALYSFLSGITWNLKSETTSSRVHFKELEKMENVSMKNWRVCERSLKAGKLFDYSLELFPTYLFRNRTLEIGFAPLTNLFPQDNLIETRFYMRIVHQSTRDKNIQNCRGNLDKSSF